MLPDTTSCLRSIQKGTTDVDEADGSTALLDFINSPLEYVCDASHCPENAGSWQDETVFS